MEYRRTGRGGAGNYYSKQDIEDASKKTDKERDIEAQKPEQPTLDASTASQSAYRSSGRGGAGNVAQSTTTADHPSDPSEINVSTAKSATSNPGYYGRGGAGNYAGSIVTPGQPQERELQDMRRTDIYANAEAGLQEPQKAHLKSADEN